MIRPRLASEPIAIAEWPFTDGSSDICCIMQEDTASSNYNCVTYIGSRDPDGVMY